MPIIKLDTKKAKELGFTSDKFTGWLWLDDKFIWVSFIVSKQEGKGNLRALFDKTEEAGYRIIVPTPSIRMEMICRKRGMVKRRTKSNKGDMVEIMIKL